MNPQQDHTANKKLNPPTRQHQQLLRVPVKMVAPEPALESSQLQRKLLNFLYLYAILIVCLYVTYAVYYFVSQHQQAAAKRATADHQLQPLAQVHPPKQEEPNLLRQELESKIHLLERYIELVAIDLQETKNKLHEREKCDCSISCTFNGTRYHDRSSWQHQCDTCSCLSGRISCQPRKCAPTNCDDAVQLPGQCCPTCMKKCKHNNSIIRHGHKLVPVEPHSRKECRCYDGVIKCEQVQSKLSASNSLDSSHSSSSTGGSRSETKRTLKDAVGAALGIRQSNSTEVAT